MQFTYNEDVGHGARRRDEDADPDDAPDGAVRWGQPQQLTARIRFFASRPPGSWCSGSNCRRSKTGRAGTDHHHRDGRNRPEGSDPRDGLRPRKAPTRFVGGGSVHPNPPGAQARVRPATRCRRRMFDLVKGPWTVWTLPTDQTSARLFLRTFTGRLFDPALAGEIDIRDIAHAPRRPAGSADTCGPFGRAAQRPGSERAEAIDQGVTSGVCCTTRPRRICSTSRRPPRHSSRPTASWKRSCRRPSTSTSAAGEVPGAVVPGR